MRTKASKMILEPKEIAKLKRLLEEALQLLTVKTADSKRLTPKQKDPLGSHTEELIFSLNIRAFMKRYGSKGSGTQKFTLLVARLAQGKVGHAVSVKDVESWWNKMKGILGAPYNSAHSTRAKDRGWVDSPKFGIYALSDDWMNAVGC